MESAGMLKAADLWLHIAHPHTHTRTAKIRLKREREGKKRKKMVCKISERGWTRTKATAAGSTTVIVVVVVLLLLLLAALIVGSIVLASFEPSQAAWQWPI